jgi:DNA polymerase I-like protein with 3'-5' exonuclease and polymerase domains
VYDITNAGPRHRYTVSGKLVANSNLSFQYRISARAATAKARVQYELDVREPFVAAILATYKAAFPGVPRYWLEQIFKCKAAGYAETFAGRRVQLNGSWIGREKWPLESTAINYPIQGTGGDQKYLALAVLRDILTKYNAHFYFELHDGIYAISPTDKTKDFFLEAKRSLSDLPYKAAWGAVLPIQFPVDGKIGPTWGDMYEPEWAKD